MRGTILATVLLGALVPISQAALFKAATPKPTPAPTPPVSFPSTPPPSVTTTAQYDENGNLIWIPECFIIEPPGVTGLPLQVCDTNHPQQPTVVNGRNYMWQNGTLSPMGIDSLCGIVFDSSLIEAIEAWPQNILSRLETDPVLPNTNLTYSFLLPQEPDGSVPDVFLAQAWYKCPSVEEVVNKVNDALNTAVETTTENVQAAVDAATESLNAAVNTATTNANAAVDTATINANAAKDAVAAAANNLASAIPTPKATFPPTKIVTNQFASSTPRPSAGSNVITSSGNSAIIDIPEPETNKIVPFPTSKTGSVTVDSGMSFKGMETTSAAPIISCYPLLATLAALFVGGLVLVG